VRGGEDGFTTVELLTVMAILGIVLGALVSLFAAGMNSSARQNARYQSQQELRVAMDRLRGEVHTACTISAPSTYNTPMSSVTIYYGTDNCASGTHTVTWCTVGSGSSYSLYRIGGSTCTGATRRFARKLTSGTVFTYLPPNSHLVTSTSLGQGTSSSSIVTSDGSSVLARLHVDLTSNQGRSGDHSYRLIGDIAFRTGPRACSAGVASC
jgi:prepilin-type N-terminal cleavage/methylation domain-containing protein